MSKKETVSKKRFRSVIASKFSLQEYPFMRFPFKLLLAFGVILVCLAVFFLLRSKTQEESRLYEEMKSRADVLIWAVEGGARSLKPGQPLPPPPPRAFVEEMASQPNVMYLAILDEQGVAIVHSNPLKTGTTLLDKKRLLALGDANISTGFLVTEDEGQHYDVVKAFTPAMHHMKMKRHMSMMGRRSDLQEDTNAYAEAPAKKVYILVSIDPAPFLTVLHQHTWHFVIISCLLILSAITGVALLIFVRNFNTSKKLLEDTQTFALQVFDMLPIGVFTTDNEGTITLCNKESLAILGGIHKAKNANAIPGFDWKFLTRSVDSGATVFEEEYEFSHQEGRTTVAGVSAYPLAYKKQGDSEYLFIVRDLGDVKRLQKQVRLNERLTALGNLAAGVAHEIRNPLSTIKGYATYLTGKLHSPDDQGMAELMLEEMDRLNRVVSDLLNMAKQNKLQLAETSIMPLVSKVIRLAQPEADSKGIRLTYTSTDDYVAMLDEDKLLQALLNLLINAIQATSAGKEVSLHTASKDDSLLITIHDEGHGMDAETQSRLFSPYFTTKASGTGLGLTITHQIIEQHEGQIRVQSEPHKGSTFTVILPQAKGLHHGE